MASKRRGKVNLNNKDEDPTDRFVRKAMDAMIGASPQPFTTTATVTLRGDPKNYILLRTGAAGKKKPGKGLL